MACPASAAVVSQNRRNCFIVFVEATGACKSNKYAVMAAYTFNKADRTEDFSSQSDDCRIESPSLFNF